MAELLKLLDELIKCSEKTSHAGLLQRAKEYRMCIKSIDTRAEAVDNIGTLYEKISKHMVSTSNSNLKNILSGIRKRLLKQGVLVTVNDEGRYMDISDIGGPIDLDDL